MADLEQDVFDAGASEAPPPDIAPAQPSVSPPSQDSQAVTNAIDALRGPVPNYGTQPHPQTGPSSVQPPPPPNPDDEVVKVGGLRDLLNERAARQRAESHLRDLQAREAERQKQQQQPKPEDLLFTDPAAVLRQIEEANERKLANMQLNFDMQLASMRHGPLFDQAWQHWSQTVADRKDPVSYYRVMNARSPGEEMVRWFHERYVMHETGGDLNAFRQRVASELLQDPQFLAYMQNVQNGSMPPPQAQPQRGQAQARGEDGRFVPQQQPRHEVRLPPSLSRMNGAGRGMPPDGMEDGSEEAIFDAGRPRSRE